MDRRRQKIIDQRFPIGQRTGEKTADKGDQKAETDPGKGKPDGCPEICRYDEDGKCLQRIQRADQQDVVVDDRGTDLPNEDPKGNDAYVFYPCRTLFHDLLHKNRADDGSAALKNL